MPNNTEISAKRINASPVEIAPTSPIISIMIPATEPEGALRIRIWSFMTRTGRTGYAYRFWGTDLVGGTGPF